MATNDYTTQLKDKVNIANKINLDEPIEYEYKLVDSIGKTPDQSLVYYTKNNLDQYIACPIEYVFVDTNKPPINGESYYKYTEDNGYEFVGSVDYFEQSTPNHVVKYAIRKDFEFDPREKYYIKVKPSIGFTTVSKFENISNNHKYLKDYAVSIFQNRVGEILNRHVFKFTKLREDIIFIRLILIKPGSSSKGKNFIIAVNERSFWNRLFFYKADNPTSRYLPIDKVDPFDLLLASLRNSKDISRITFKLVSDEAERIQELYNDLNENKDEQKKILEYNIVNNANVEILGFEHFSKRLWIGYFDSIFNSSNINVFTAYEKGLLGILNYKDNENIAFYNPDDPNFSEYSLFYQGQ